MRLVASLLEIVNCVKPRAISRDTFGDEASLKGSLGPEDCMKSWHETKAI